MVLLKWFRRECTGLGIFVFCFFFLGLGIFDPSYVSARWLQACLAFSTPRTAAPESSGEGSGGAVATGKASSWLG